MSNKHGYGGRAVATAAVPDRGEAANVAGLSIASWMHGPLVADAGEDGRVAVRAIYCGVPQRDEELDRLPPYVEARLRERDKPEEALALYHSASAAGDSACMTRLGQIHLHGLLGIAPDVDKGLAWLRQASTAGDTVAMVELGVYHCGEGKEHTAGAESGVDHSLGVEYLFRAACLHDAQALWHLARICKRDGITCPDGRDVHDLYRELAQCVR